MLKKTLGTALVLALGTLTIALGATTAAQANEHEDHHADESMGGHSHMMSEIHGGHAVMTPHHHFEVLFAADQARVYVYDDEQKPMMDPKDLSGTIALSTKEGSEKKLNLEYMAPNKDDGRIQGYYAAPYDFSKVSDGSMKAMVTMMGLSKKPVEFKTAVEVSEPMTYACPMGCVSSVPDPGACPKCGMQLKPEDGDHHGHMEMDGHEGHMDEDGHGGH